MSSEITYEATSRVLDTGQGPLHYHEAGEGAPVLLLHGSGPGVSSWANFRRNLPVFSETFRCLALDLPGFGRSPLGADHVRQSAPDTVVRFLDGMGIERVSIIGNSMGGGVGSRVAAEHPDRVDRLVTIGGIGINIFSPAPGEGIILLSQFVEDPTRERLVSWMQSMVFDHGILTEEMIDERFQQATIPSAQAAMKQIYSSANLEAMRQMRNNSDYATNALGFLSKIQAPTLITWGRDDRVSPLDMALAPMRLIRHCEVHIFPNCGHWAMIERQAEFENVVGAFLSRKS